MTGRSLWLAYAEKMARPVLSAQAEGGLLADLPRWAGENNTENRIRCGPLEAFSRLSLGLVPWLSSSFAVPEPESSLRSELLRLSQLGLKTGLDAHSPDGWDLHEGAQRLVDVAFLAHSVVRNPGWVGDQSTSLARAFDAVRDVKPPSNNWLLFAAMVEAATMRLGRAYRMEPIEVALAKHAEWYAGDGHYGDGPLWHADYYNSYVIHPMLDDLLDIYPDVEPELSEKQPQRSQRFGCFLERLISPDGSFPPIGRSIAYRTGAFHHLAAMALKSKLPKQLTPAQVRTGLERVLVRCLGAPQTYDENGWLTPGLCGIQPSLAEPYVCIGSLYLASAIFLPLGLAPEDPFWADPAEPTTWERIWSGEDFPRDAAIRE